VPRPYQGRGVGAGHARPEALRNRSDGSVVLVLLCLKKNNLVLELFCGIPPFFARPTQRRFAAYIEGLAKAAGHADRHTPVKNYCTDCCCQGSARVSSRWRRAWPQTMFVAPTIVAHLVAGCAMDDEEMLAQVRREVLPTMRRHGPVSGVDRGYTGFRTGKPFCGCGPAVLRGQLGKQEQLSGGREFVGEHLEYESAIAWRLYSAGGVVPGSEAVSGRGSGRG